MVCWGVEKGFIIQMAVIKQSKMFLNWFGSWSFVLTSGGSGQQFTAAQLMILLNQTECRKTSNSKSWFEN